MTKREEIQAYKAEHPDADKKPCIDAILATYGVHPDSADYKKRFKGYGNEWSKLYGQRKPSKEESAAETLSDPNRRTDKMTITMTPHIKRRLTTYSRITGQSVSDLIESYVLSLEKPEVTDW